MIPLPPRFTITDTLFPYTTLVVSTGLLRMGRCRYMTVASRQRPPRSTWMCRCCGLITLEDQCRVGAAKSERIAQHPAHALVACRVWHEIQVAAIIGLIEEIGRASGRERVCQYV